MILNDTQVHLIAEHGRRLSDAVLAPLVLQAVLGMLGPQPTVEPPTATAPLVDTPSEPIADAAPQRRRGPGKRTQASLDAAVVFVTSNPGCSMQQIYTHLGCERTWARKIVAQALQDGRIERHGLHQDTRYYPVAVDAEPKPAVLLTEQRIDGSNQQKLVRVERRRGVAKRTLPATAKQRQIAIVEYVRTHPGAQRADIAKHVGGGMPQVQYALRLVARSGEIRMDGERATARYYVRGYVNGAAASAVVAESRAAS
jgi:hypothetical protein